MPDKDTPDHPLVTFVLFAYNQEDYIRDAVESAFAQTYKPLEIILSDDCSSDRTFNIMQEMAASYRGPHKVYVRQTERNQGITHHFLQRVREAKGEVIVVAAGDDISKPERCEAHLSYYHDPSVMAVTGLFDLMDENGNVFAINSAGTIIKSAGVDQGAVFYDFDRYTPIQGSTASYRKEIFRYEMPNEEIAISEDVLMGYMIHLFGFKVASCRESLIKYRVHAGALTNKPLEIERKVSCLEEIERNRQRAAKKEINRIETFLWIAKRHGKTERIKIEQMRRGLIDQKDIECWERLDLKSRIFSLLRTVYLRKRYLVIWKCCRLLGRVHNYQPITFFRQNFARMKGRSI